VLRAKADVVALQETAGLGPPERERLRAAYPYWATCHPGCDLILMSKTPWTDIGSQQQMVPGGYFAVVWATATAPDGRPFTLATTHYAWPFPPAPQAAQRTALAKAIGALPADHLILTDFNLTPWSSALRTQDTALAPLQRRTHAVFTWPANIAVVKWPAPFPLLPIDQVYAGPAWSTLAVHRLPRLGSDHYPVLVELVRAKPKG
jgi:vancomycin resistance protein VanJ